MAFRLKLKEPIGDGVRRLLAAQIDRAEVELGAVVEADGHDASSGPTRVHETRKCIKRARAVLRFAKPLIEKPDFKDLNSAFRDLGRTLSLTRDLDVLDHTIKGLEAAAALKPATVVRLKRSFADARANHAAAISVDRAVRGEAFAQLRSRVAAVAIEDVGRHLATGGIAACLDDFRDHFDRAFAHDEPGIDRTSASEAFHEWRKSVQLHWRHMQLVDRSWPDFCRARREEARVISQLIGDDRDLAMLQAFAVEHLLPKTVQGDIESAIAGISPGLRLQAKARGERLLAERSAGLCRRLEQYWQAAQHLRKAGGSDREPAATDKAPEAN